MAVVIETTVGDITVDLYVDRRPQTCKNFLKLCKIKYYNFCLFHSIQSNFLAQTGDPSGTGTGGESVFGIVYGEAAKFFEAETMPKIKHTKPGLLSMVNCGNNMLGSQFFVTLGADLQSLDEHCIFAEVVDGHDVLLKLNSAICDNEHRPYMDIRITHTVVLQDPFEDPSGLMVPEMSPEAAHNKLANGRIGADEKIDETEGLTAAQVEELKQEREAKARATILEIVGDLPDAEMAPPENVLFVCKLNPVTNDDDLQTLFSRFGKVKSCEVIRDPKSGDSLQYAFVEFEDKRACEAAYFKMDNVLIDDRRIHVDFSQSVAKMRWRGKGRGVEYFDKDPGKERAGSSSYRPEEYRSHSSTRRDHYQDRERRHHSWDVDDKRRRRDGETEHSWDGDDKRRRREGDAEHSWDVDDKRRKRDVDLDRHKSDYRKNDSKYRRDDRRREDWREDNSKKVEDGRRYDESKRRDHEDLRKRDDDPRKRDEDLKRTDRRRDDRKTDDRKTDDRRRDNKRGSEKKKDSDRSQRDKKHNSDKHDKKESKKLKEDYNERSDKFKAVTSVDVLESTSKALEVDLDDSFTEKTEANFDLLDKSDSQENNYQESTDEINLQKEEKENLNDDIKHNDLIINHDSHNVEHESNTKLKRKRDNSENRYRKKRRNSSSSDSSSESSESSDSSSSSDSASSNYKYKGKHKMIVAKKYYQGGKLVKEVKKKRRHDTSDSETLSEDSSDSEYRKKKKGKKRKKVIVKIIKKRKKKIHSSEDSDSASSSTDDESERKPKKKKRKDVDKYMKKRRKNAGKKKKRRRSDHSSNSSDSEGSSKRKNGNKRGKKLAKEGSHHPISE